MPIGSDDRGLSERHENREQKHCRQEDMCSPSSFPLLFLNAYARKKKKSCMVPERIRVTEHRCLERQGNASGQILEAAGQAEVVARSLQAVGRSVVQSHSQ